MVQLQPADWLAYEIRKFVADHDIIMTGTRKFRASLGILPKDKVKMKFFNFRRTAEFCNDKGIPRRGAGVVRPSGTYRPLNVICQKCGGVAITVNANAVIKIAWGRTFKHETCGFTGPWVWESPENAAVQASPQKPA